MPTPTISSLPELPVFPAGPGLPDQPRPFFTKLLAFLIALDTTHRAELAALAAYLEGLGGGGGGSVDWGAIGGTLADQTDLVAALTDKQDASANLTAFAGIAPSDDVQSLLAGANYAAIKTLLGLVIGTNVQAYHATLAALAGVATNGLLTRTGEGTVAARTITAGAGISVTNGDGVSGNPTIAVSAFRGALVKTAGATGVNYSAVATIPFELEEYDTSGIHDNVTNNSRLTVPSGVTKVRLTGYVAIASATANVNMFVSITKNGGSYAGQPTPATDTDSPTPRVNLAGPVLAVTAGDYFEMTLVTGGDTSIDIAATSWLAMEIIE